MPIPTDYASLQTEVGGYLKKPELTGQIPSFISYAEERLANDLRITPLVKEATVTILAFGTAGTMPTGHKGIVSVADMTVTPPRKLEYVAPDQYVVALSNANGIARPLYFTLTDTMLQAAPAWTAGGNLTVKYFKKETALSGSNTTNWYLQNAANMLLYATMLEAMPFVLNLQAAGMWKEYYQYARDALNEQYGVVDAYQRSKRIEAGSGKALSPTL